jgi:hypothetical protein
MPRPRTYEGTQITWDYDWDDQSCALTLDCEYVTREGSRPDAALFDPGEPAECELEAVTVTGALVGPDRREATPDELKAIQKQLRRNPVEMGLIESYLQGIVL